MAIVLSKEEVENVKNYKYSTSPATPLDGIYDPWWNFVQSITPKSISPNLITCCGIIWPIISFVYMCTYDMTQTAVLPASVLVMSGMSIFWYQTLDAIDGKHARKTDNCSVLGQLLDHNLDQFSHSFFVIMGIAMTRSGDRIWPILMVVNGQLLPHYTIEYRKHFTQFQATVVNMGGGLQIGATECCLIMYGLQFLFAAIPGTNTSMIDEYDLQKMLGLPFALTVRQGDAICFSTFILSVQYNLGNFYAGYQGAKDKTHALACTIPFFTAVFILYFASRFSQFWTDYVVCFIWGVGMLMTNMTGNLNLKSCVLVKYNPIYIDPFIFAGLLYLDANRLVEPNYLAAGYTILVIQRAIQYALFMRSMITQLTHYLDIPFLETKQVYLANKKSKKH